MPSIDPNLLRVLTDLARGLRELGVPFAVVGALVPELLLDARPSRMTNDADVTVIVDSLVAFEALKDRLSDYGFARTSVPHRLKHHDGGLVDVLPFSEAIVPDGKLRLLGPRLGTLTGTLGPTPMCAYQAHIVIP